MIKVPLLVPDLPGLDEITPWLKRIDEAKWYTNFGPLVRQFESSLAATLSADGRQNLYLSTVTNATAGLQLALFALGLRKGARVLLPAFTFVATAAAVESAGFEPVLADIDGASWILTPEIARDALVRTEIDAVMPVATFGCPQDAAGWDAFYSETGLPIVIDAAAAFGNQRIGEKNIVVFSLHTTKCLGIGEGGFVVARNAEVIERVRRMSNFGIREDGLVQFAGFNGKMSEIHAAVGLAALEAWPEKRKKRLALAESYKKLLQQNCPGVGLQQRPDSGTYPILSVRLPQGINVRLIQDRLAEQGIQTRRWYYPPLYEHPAFVGRQEAGELGTTRHLVQCLLGLPFHLYLDRSALEHVTMSLVRSLEGAGR